MKPDPSKPLSLADLESYDPQAPHSLGERRFACPLCGDSKTKSATHRCLCLNSASGLWNCNRCKASGKLSDFYQERPTTTRRQRSQEQLSQICSLPLVTPLAAPRPEKLGELHRALKDCELIAANQGAKYLQERGIALDASQARGVRFSQNWLGRPAVLFPIRDRDGALVAAQGRYVDGRSDPKARTVGEKKHGLFAVRGAWDVPKIIITEAPLDALSLATAGYPALALCGTSGPAWLPKAMAFKRVLLAFDADPAGDQAAGELTPVLGSLGARAQRLRPEGAKDWNEMLHIIGRDALADFLAPAVLLD